MIWDWSISQVLTSLAKPWDVLTKVKRVWDDRRHRPFHGHLLIKHMVKQGTVVSLNLISGLVQLLFQIRHIFMRLVYSLLTYVIQLLFQRTDVQRRLKCWDMRLVHPFRKRLQNAFLQIGCVPTVKQSGNQRPCYETANHAERKYNELMTV